MDYLVGIYAFIIDATFVHRLRPLLGIVHDPIIGYLSADLYCRADAIGTSRVKNDVARNLF
jgi:hypothetical protein